MSNEPMLYNLEDAGIQLGGVCQRTVRRLISSRKLAGVQVGRRVMVPATSLRLFINKQVESESEAQAIHLEAVRGSSSCHTKDPTALIGGARSPLQAARELDGLLKPPISRKR